MRGTGPETHPGQTKETKDQADFNGPGGSLLGLVIFFILFWSCVFFVPFHLALFWSMFIEMEGG